MNISEVAWTDIESFDADVAVIPVGSIEQHGPHAPLGTDWLTAAHLAEAVSTASTHNILVGPTIPVGIAEEHRHFAGTLWVSPDTFRSYVRETVESLLTHDIDRCILVNGHGGNAAAIREIAEQITRDTDAIVAGFTWFDAIGEPLANLGHGGPLETAFIWHIRPELIHTDRIDLAAAEASDRWGTWVAGVNIAVDTIEFTTSGVIGDPREASPERGAKLVDTAVSALGELIDTLVEAETTHQT